MVHLPLQINPQTATVSIPSGPADQIPHIIKGVVIHLGNIENHLQFVFAIDRACLGRFSLPLRPEF